MIEINDTTKDSEVKFTLDYSKEREVVNLTIIPHKEVVYLDRARKKVLLPPEEIKLYLTNQQTQELCAGLISCVSIFFEESFLKTVHLIETSNGYKIEVEKDKSSMASKSLMTIYDHDKIVLILRLRKNKIFFLLDWIKNVFDSGVGRGFRLRVATKNDYVYEVGRSKEGLLMARSVVLLQREMDIIRYLVDEMIYAFSPEKFFESKVEYKQINILYDPIYKRVLLIINNGRKNKKELHMELSPSSVAALFLSISKTSPPQKETPEDLLLKPSHMTRIANVFVSFEKIENQSYSFKQKRGGLKMTLCDISGGKQEYVFIDLKEKWNLVLALLIELYHGRESAYNDKGKCNYVWRFQNLQKDGTSKFIELRVLAQRDTKQCAGMIVKTSRSKTDSSSKVDNTIFISFSRHMLHGFITTFISACDEIDGFEYSFKNHLEEKKRFGLKKKKWEVEVSMERDLKIALLPSDAALLKSSARYKIFHDRWLGFQGDSIALSSEGYLTDMKREYLVENDQKTALASFLSYGGERP